MFLIIKVLYICKFFVILKVLYFFNNDLCSVCFFFCIGFNIFFVLLFIWYFNNLIFENKWVVLIGVMVGIVNVSGLIFVNIFCVGFICLGYFEIWLIIMKGVRWVKIYFSFCCFGCFWRVYCFFGVFFWFVYVYWEL